MSVDLRISPDQIIERYLSMELVRVTERAAVSAARWRGHGNEKAADQAAVDAMRRELNRLPIDGEIVIDKPGLNLANGAIGIGEITSIPTAPAIAQAYYRYDGERRRSLPLDHTPYKK